MSVQPLIFSGTGHPLLCSPDALELSSDESYSCSVVIGDWLSHTESLGSALR
jgi:hypothetical protein